MNSEGTVFDIQHFCTGDGPGIRTTVFLKGCPLRCAWCHNPESWSPEPQVLLNLSRCIRCSSCEAVCPAGDPKAILASAPSRKASCSSGCRLCADACPTGSLEVAGRTTTVASVLEEVLQDEAYYRHSGGGLTLSGGEPFAQPAFSRALLEAAVGAGLHTAVETSGHGARESFLAAAPFVRLWLWDIKLMDADLYREYVGGRLETMLGNLEAVAASGAGIRFRVLFIPQLHGRTGVAEATADLLHRYPGSTAEVIPYHLLGNAKRGKLGLPEVRFREPSATETHAFAVSLGLSR